MTDTAKDAAPPAAIRIDRFLPEQPISRARRAALVAAIVENVGDAEVDVTARLALPEGLRLLAGDAESALRLAAGDKKQFAWQLEAAEPADCELLLQVEAEGHAPAEASLSIQFLTPVEVRELPYIPEPEPVRTSALVGAHHCPLWEADKPQTWDNILKHPERTPALGFYSQENPEVSDWETKWAVEHGISFFVYCWYRTSQGGPVEMRFSSAIHDALFHSRFVDRMKFTIMWENQARGKAGVADERDLMDNLLPFWIENYFTHPSYLKIDNKPALFVYRPEFLVDDLGSAADVARALDRMREACRREGFDGLILLGEYRGLDVNHFKLMAGLGLDYTFAYCWWIGNDPTPEEAIRAQMDYIARTQELSLLPQVVTVSQAWSGWHDEGTIWKIPPREFEDLLRRAKDYIAALPAGGLTSRMLLLDNWNEWGEGHYIAPYREYGFGYLDAVRRVFSDAPELHIDLIPEDIGMGPYDTAYKAHQRSAQNG